VFPQILRLRGAFSIPNPESRSHFKHAPQHFTFAVRLLHYLEFVSQRNVTALKQGVMDFAQADDVGEISPCGGIIGPAHNMARIKQSRVCDVAQSTLMPVDIERQQPETVLPVPPPCHHLHVVGENIASEPKSVASYRLVQLLVGEIVVFGDDPNNAVEMVDDELDGRLMLELADDMARW
jgi:hypothetical protein